MRLQETCQIQELDKNRQEMTGHIIWKDDTPDARAKHTEQLVLRKLQRSGLKVEKKGNSYNKCDLLVNDTYRVEVKSSLPRFSKKHTSIWILSFIK
jgi:hypothetical protein